MAVKITLLTEERIRLEALPGPMTIEADSAERVYSPFHMVASGLATCVQAVLASWAETVGVAAEDLVLEVGWSFAEKPHRIGAFELVLHWPSLPEPRRAVAGRVAALCPIHATLLHSAEIHVQVAA